MKQFVFHLLALVIFTVTHGSAKDAAENAAYGTVALEKGDYKSAIAYLDEAIRLDPSVPKQVYLWRGQAFAGAGEHKRAISDFQLVVADQTEPPKDRAECLLDLALSHEALGNHGDAFDDYEKALKLDPKSYRALNDFAWFLATTSVERFRDGKRSLSLAQDAVRLAGKTEPAILDTLAASYAATGDFKSAVAALEQAILLAGSDPVVSSLNARLELYKAGKPFIAPPMPVDKAEKGDVASP